jgi:formylglycine-generating enzyme required for sulfatase activity
MIGNLWEWTTDWYSAAHQADAAKACCTPDNPRGADRDELRFTPAGYPNSAQGGKGRVVPVCAKLLPTLSTGGAATADGGLSR